MYKFFEVIKNNCFNMIFFVILKIKMIRGNRVGRRMEKNIFIM